MTVKLSLFPGCFSPSIASAETFGLRPGLDILHAMATNDFPSERNLHLFWGFDDWRLFLGHMSYLDGTVTSYFS